MDTNKQPPNRALTSWLALGVSVLNGAVGDYLNERQNGLAITMGCYHNGVPLALTHASLRHTYPVLTPKICVLIHGLACTEDLWRFSDQQPSDQPSSYGSLLQQDLGYTPLYLRYNTGLRISENGKHLAALLSELYAAYPMPIEEIVLIGHSMGGLVIRSACHYGEQQQCAWIRHIRRVFYLGTPHEGAALERVGNAVSSTLGAVPHPVPRLIRKVFNLRSQGIKDLRFGNLVDDDWCEHNRDSCMQNRRIVPWLASAEHYLIAGTLTRDPQHIAAQIFGDLLVGLTSAHCEMPEDSSVTAAHMKLFSGVHHIRLVRHPEVYQQIKSWCEPLIKTARDRAGGQSSPGRAMPLQNSQVSLLCSDTCIIGTTNTSRASVITNSQIRQLQGLSELVCDTIEVGTREVEVVYQTFARTSFTLLGQFWGVAPAVRGVELVHNRVAGLTFQSIRAISCLVGVLTQRLITHIPDKAGH